MIDKTVKTCRKLVLHLLDCLGRRFGPDHGKLEKLIERDDVVLSGLHWVNGDAPSWC
jgi:hypothetical protein